MATFLSLAFCFSWGFIIMAMFAKQPKRTTHARVTIAPRVENFAVALLREAAAGVGEPVPQPRRLLGRYGEDEHLERVLRWTEAAGAMRSRTIREVETDLDVEKRASLPPGTVTSEALAGSRLDEVKSKATIEAERLGRPVACLFNGYWLLALPDDDDADRGLARLRAMRDRYKSDPRSEHLSRLWNELHACNRVDGIVQDIVALRSPAAGGSLDGRPDLDINPEARAVRHIKNVDDAIEYWTEHVQDGEQLRYFVDRHASGTMAHMWREVFRLFPFERRFGWKASAV